MRRWSEPNVAVEDDKQLLKNALRSLEKLNTRINEYVQAYIDAYETLFDSVLTRSYHSNDNVALIRQGMAQAMQRDTSALYEQLHRHVTVFHQIFKEIGGHFRTCRHFRMKQHFYGKIVRPEQKENLNAIIERSKFLDHLIHEATQRMKEMQDRVIQTKEHHGMIAVPPKRHDYPDLPTNWFPRTGNFETIPTNWYRLAHRLLLRTVESKVTEADHLLQPIKDRHHDLKSFVNTHKLLLQQYVPRFDNLMQALTSTDQRIGIVTRRLTQIRGLTLEDVSEREWRVCITRAEDLIKTDIPRINQEQSHIIHLLYKLRDVYAKSDDIHLDDLVNEFAKLFNLEE